MSGADSTQERRDQKLRNSNYQPWLHFCVCNTGCKYGCLTSYDADGRSHGSQKSHEFPLREPSCCPSTRWNKLCDPHHWNGTATPRQGCYDGENEGLCLRQLPSPAFRISHSSLRELPLPVSSMTKHRKKISKLPSNFSRVQRNFE